MKVNAKLITWAIALGFTSGAFAASHSSTAMPPSASASASMAPMAKGHMSPNADNTEMNARDKDGATKTPQDQTNTVPDRKLLAAVRRAVVDDKSLSVKAHNIKIMVTGGAVTLRGPTDSADETTKIEALVKGVKGVTKVDNQLDIKAK